MYSNHKLTMFTKDTNMSFLFWKHENHIHAIDIEIRMVLGIESAYISI